MRLAVVRASYTAFGGAERIVNRIVRTLAEQGVAVTILARRWSSDATEALPRTVSWQRLDPFYLGKIGRQWSFARAVRRTIANRDFDLVQSHERIAGVALYRAGDGVHREWLRQRSRALPAWRRWLLALDPNHAYQRHAERALFLDPALRTVVCNSNMVRDELRAWFDLPQHKLAVIRNGVDLARFRPPSAAERAAARAALGLQLGLESARFVLVFVGAGFERKGLAAALDALARVPEASLLVVGKDRRMASYQRRTRVLGLQNRVQFAGPQRDVVPYLHAADAFVLPTLYDPQPNAALEAMACGLPLITSTKCGAAELLREAGDEMGGIVVDALDIDALADAIQRLSDPDLARRMGARARRAIEPYTLERMSDEYLSLYRRLLSQPATSDAEHRVRTA